MVLQSHVAMARGGIYDQVGGGFHRYAVDEAWLVPHFEKMLYDNALLSRIYTLAYLASGAPDLRRVAEDTFAYLLRELCGPHGGFFAAQDADSEGGEGAFYLWTPEEVEALLGPDDARLICRFYGITPEGQLEGKSIPHVSDDPQRVAAEFSLSLEDLLARI
ncbi:MAG: thioredoxin domain-containing protein, partial [Candidatus Bipolaricaulota bacterium]|nr:thioredoxin domain-containing protein [Candidatus Bipolaricaulota bacterium]